MRLPRSFRKAAWRLLPITLWAIAISGTRLFPTTPRFVIATSILVSTPSTTATRTSSTTTGEFSYIDGAYDNVSAGLTDIFIAIVDTTDPNYSLKYFSYLGGAN